jgi:hypothetical protein
LRKSKRKSRKSQRLSPNLSRRRRSRNNQKKSQFKNLRIWKSLRRFLPTMVQRMISIHGPRILLKFLSRFQSLRAPPLRCLMSRFNPRSCMWRSNHRINH